MSGQLGELVVSISADLARFKEDMGKAQRVTNDTMKRMQMDVSSGMKAVETQLKSAAGLLVGFAGAASFGGLVKSMIDLQDEMSKTAQKAGVNISELSGMAYAAGLADVSTEQLAKSLGKLNKAMYEAAGDPNGGPAKTFRSLGVSVTDAAGKLRKADEVMIDLAGKFAGMKDGAEKTALSMEVFGKSGADMIPLLNGGAQGLKDATEEAKRFGLVMSEEAGKQAEKFNDNLTRLKSQVSGMALTLANEALPSIISVSDAMVNNGSGGAAAFGKSIAATVRSIQEATIYWATFADKVGAWNDTGGLLGHALSGKKAAEYKQQLQNIATAEAQQMAAIAAAYDRASMSSPGKAGSDGGSASGAETIKAAADAAEQARIEFNKGVQGYNKLVDTFNASRTDLSDFEKSIAKVNEEVATLSKEHPEQAKDAKILGEKIKAQLQLTEAIKKQNEMMEESARLTEQVNREWALAGLSSGRTALVAPSAGGTMGKDGSVLGGMPKFSLSGAAGTMGFGGNATSPTIDTDKLAREREAVTVAMLNNQMALVDTAERFYQTTTGEAAAKRIDLLNQELVAQKSIYDSIQGDGADAVMARIQEQAVINDINEKLLEQQKILASTTALGGMTVALDEYARAAKDVGAQLDYATTNMLHNMEDALVSFVTTGKASFSDFADAVIKDLARIAVQQSVMGPLSELGKLGLSALGGMFGSSSSMPAQNGYAPMDLYSAAGGFDIPAGVNPVVQTHAKEMILPAEYAEVIRGMSKEPAAAPSQTTISVPVTVEGNNKLSSALRDAIEETVLQVLRRHA